MKVKMGDVVSGLWIDPAKPLPRMPKTAPHTLEIITTPLPSRCGLYGAAGRSSTPDRPSTLVFWPKRERVLYEMQNGRLYPACDNAYELPLELQAFLAVQLQAVGTTWDCASRQAGGDAPDWFWFHKKRQTDDGSYALVTRVGLVVGNVYKGLPRVLKTPDEVRRWQKRHR